MVTNNILHNFRGYTYNITLKSLSVREYNNAYNYGFNMQNGVVLKSSGTGGNSKRVPGATNLELYSEQIRNRCHNGIQQKKQNK